MPRSSKPKNGAKDRPPPPIKQKTDKLAGRNYLTEQEVKGMITSAKGFGRCGQRDSTMILVAFRHGLRCTPRW